MVKPFLRGNTLFFPLLSTIKVNLVAKIMQSAYLCGIFHVKLKKLPFLAVLAGFLIFGKIQDGDHCWWRHRPPAAPPPIKYTSSCREDQRLSTKGKIVSKYCNISNTSGGGGDSIQPSIHPTPPPPGTTVGIWICVYVRGLILHINACVSVHRFTASSYMSVRSLGIYFWALYLEPLMEACTVPFKIVLVNPKY